MTPAERFASAKRRLAARLAPAANGCLEFNGQRTARGYGVMQGPDRQEGAHRVSWRVHRGAIPDGLFVLHKCDNPPCCNPDHLWLGTKKENSQDMVAKGRHYSFSRGRAACWKGHPYTPENTRIDKKGRRVCRECDRVVRRKYREARRAQRQL